MSDAIFEDARTLTTVKKSIGFSLLLAILASTYLLFQDPGRTLTYLFLFGYSAVGFVILIRNKLPPPAETLAGTEVAKAFTDKPELLVETEIDRTVRVLSFLHLWIACGLWILAAVENNVFLCLAGFLFSNANRGLQNGGLTNPRTTPP